MLLWFLLLLMLLLSFLLLLLLLLLLRGFCVARDESLVGPLSKFHPRNFVFSDRVSSARQNATVSQLRNTTLSPHVPQILMCFLRDFSGQYVRLFETSQCRSSRFLLCEDFPFLFVVFRPVVPRVALAHIVRGRLLCRCCVQAVCLYVVVCLYAVVVVVVVVVIVVVVR